MSSDGVVLEEEYHLRIGENALVAALAFAVFWANFAASWLLSTRRVPEFAAFTPAQKADWCSRVNSTLHAVVVVVGVAYALADISWDGRFLPLSSIRSASFVFSIAIGYFLCDLIIIIIWPVAMQWVFIIHHIVAVVPYFVNNFVSCCAASQFGLLLFLLVELATLPLNARGFMESVGREETKNHTRSIYATYVVWGVSRMLLPVFLLFDVWAYAYPSKRNHDVCLYTNLVGAHVIALFCIGVFFFVHTPEILARRKKRHARRKKRHARRQQLSACDGGGGGGDDDDDDSRDETQADDSSASPPKSCLGSLSISLGRHKEPADADDSYDDIELGVLPRSARAS